MTQRFVVVGSGGHAKVILDILEEAGALEVVGVTSANPEATGMFQGYPILGNDDVLPELLASGVRFAFAAIGDNRKRMEITQNLTRLGFIMINAVSPRAIISRRARLGLGVAIMPGAVINADTSIGDGTIVNTGATVDHDCIIGPFCHIAPGTNLAGKVQLGEGVFMGMGCSVIPEKSIGEWTVVGAGAVVVNDLPCRVVAVGAPARVQKLIDGGCQP